MLSWGICHFSTFKLMMGAIFSICFGIWSSLSRFIWVLWFRHILSWVQLIFLLLHGWVTLNKWFIHPLNILKSWNLNTTIIELWWWIIVIRFDFRFHVKWWTSWCAQSTLTCTSTPRIYTSRVCTHYRFITTYNVYDFIYNIFHLWIKSETLSLFHIAKNCTKYHHHRSLLTKAYHYCLGYYHLTVMT